MEDLRTDTDSEDWEINLGRDNSKKTKSPLAPVN